MKKISIIALMVCCYSAGAQDVIDWNETYQLVLSDFQSPATEIGNTSIYSIQSSSTFDFSFHMSNGEFMFTKNFNSKVNCNFRRSAAVIVAPDSATADDLVAFAGYQFDLCELYARKFRKRLYEAKGAFSDVSFFHPIYDDIQKEYTERYTMAGKETRLGQDREKLAELHKQVRVEIDELADFCKTCKPAKRKK